MLKSFRNTLSLSIATECIKGGGEDETRETKCSASQLIVAVRSVAGVSPCVYAALIRAPLLAVHRMHAYNRRINYFSEIFSETLTIPRGFR